LRSYELLGWKEQKEGNLMPANYGFKGTNTNDALAITNVLAQADEVTSDDFSTLAQYQIKDVELKPATLSLGLPRQWMLTLNTNLLGFNQKNGKAIYFNNEESPVGDGYLTFALGVKDFLQMVKGGLYVDPATYLAKVKELLTEKEFYRQTRVNLTTARVLDSQLEIAVGNHHAKAVTGHDYFIGKDLQAYETFTPEREVSKRSNLEQVLSSGFKALASDPITKKRDVKLENVAKKAVADIKLPDVHVEDEVSLALSEKSEIVSATPNVESKADKVAVKNDLPPVVEVESEVVAPVEQPTDMKSLMAQLQNVQQPVAARKRRAYVDDFGKARQSSQTQQQQKVIKRQTAQHQQEHDDNGLDR
jgi:hypothetical protein